MASKIEKRSKAARKAVGKGAGTAAKRGSQGWAGLKLLERAVVPKRRRTRAVLIVAAGGTVAAIFVLGVRERRQRAAKLLRRGKAETARRADYAAGQVRGAAHEARDMATPDAPKPGLTDRDLARKVETIIFRDEDVAKGKIDVDAVGRTVSLRGEAESSEMIAELGSRTLDIPEVERVENLLHLPGEPAATRPDADRAS